MALVVEDGTGLPNADAYASLAGMAQYAADRGLAWAPIDDTAGEAALRRATAFLDATYRARFPGYRLRGRQQALEWPRQGAYTYTPDNRRSEGVLGGYGGVAQGYDDLPADEVPREILAATCEAAIRELAKPGSLSPDLKEGGAIRSVSAGSVNVTFAGAGASGQMMFQAIDLALASLLMPAGAYSGRVVRG